MGTLRCLTCNGSPDVSFTSTSTSLRLRRCSAFISHPHLTHFLLNLHQSNEQTFSGLTSLTAPSLLPLKTSLPSLPSPQFPQLYSTICAFVSTHLVVHDLLIQPPPQPILPSNLRLRKPRPLSLPFNLKLNLAPPAPTRILRPPNLHRLPNLPFPMSTLPFQLLHLPFRPFPHPPSPPSPSRNKLHPIPKMNVPATLAPPLPRPTTQKTSTQFQTLAPPL